MSWTRFLFGSLFETVSKKYMCSKSMCFKKLRFVFERNTCPTFWWMYTWPNLSNCYRDTFLCVKCVWAAEIRKLEENSKNSKNHPKIQFQLEFDFWVVVFGSWWFSGIAFVTSLYLWTVLTLNIFWNSRVPIKTTLTRHPNLTCLHHCPLDVKTCTGWSRPNW